MSRDVQRPAWGISNLALILLVVFTGSIARAQKIPSDPLGAPGNGRPPLSQAEFNGWFVSGASKQDGLVNPANSLTILQPNFDFYKWSEQMFLWISSPLPDGSGTRVFNSPTFFDISPPAADGSRTFIPHGNGPALLAVRAAQVGPHGLPVITDAHGRMLEVEQSKPNLTNKLKIESISGKFAEIEHAKISGNGKLMLFDDKGQTVHPKPSPSPAKNAPPLLVREVLLDQVPIFIDSAGNIVNVEQGQAGTNGVLVTQANSLIYYETFVNDVFAYYLTGVADKKINSDRFPTSQSELDQIKAFAAKSTKTFADSNALTVEVKAAWVEASTLPNAKDYITTTAIIPTYDTKDAAKWVPTGTKTATLALVGIHVVGSVAGHPELIWATFEHVGNAPDAAFSYVNAQNRTVSVPQDTSGSWLFCAANSAGPFNTLRNRMTAGNIVANPRTGAKTIGPSDVVRWRAWGASSTVAPNPLTSSAASNSEIILINNEVLGMLPAGDVRKNYIFKGATWTTGGMPDDGNQVGTSALANTTMETYQQGKDPTEGNGSNCFACHGPDASSFNEISHIFKATKPLFP